jgi:peptidoglycan/LPS O-acetylase OafA/YrhL
MRIGKPRLVLPFISHQVIEYVAALYLIQVGAKAGGRPAPVSYVIGGAMLAAAALSGKPLGGGRMTRPQHRFVDIVLIIAVAAAPFVFGFSDATGSVIRYEFLAVALAALFSVTSYAHPQKGQVKEIARGLKQQAPRMAGRALGRRIGKRGPTDGRPGRT